jgi:HTH-type transcriptional regulator / antitoxin HigA
MSTIAPETQQQWMAIAPILTIRNEPEYDQGVARLNGLLDEVGTDESHPLYTLLDTLAIVIEAYEEAHYPIPSCDDAEVLSYLIEEHALSNSDLPEIGSPNTVADIIKGQQSLNVQQIRALADRFGVSPAVFI